MEVRDDIIHALEENGTFKVQNRSHDELRHAAAVMLRTYDAMVSAFEATVGMVDRRLRTERCRATAKAPASEYLIEEPNATGAHLRVKWTEPGSDQIKETIFAAKFVRPAAFGRRCRVGVKRAVLHFVDETPKKQEVLPTIVNVGTRYEEELWQQICRLINERKPAFERLVPDKKYTDTMNIKPAKPLSVSLAGTIHKVERIEVDVELFVEKPEVSRETTGLGESTDVAE